MPAARTSTAEFNHQCRARGGIEDAEQAVEPATLEKHVDAAIALLDGSDAGT